MKDNTANARHYRFRVYNLTTFETFDTSGVTFDSGTESFDTGSVTDTQTYTLSFFVKQGGYQKFKFGMHLMKITCQRKRAFIQFNSETGERGNLFTDGIEREGVKTITNIAVTTTAVGTYTGLSATGSASGTGATFDVTINHENAPNTATMPSIMI